MLHNRDKSKPLVWHNGADRRCAVGGLGNEPCQRPMEACPRGDKLKKKRDKCER